ncbi:MAG: hypothetical protein Q8N63_00980 [Nanoarchaeota archaeon]|nr:hypothetical protein [Nanoarchaeota archaeon]
MKKSWIILLGMIISIAFISITSISIVSSQTINLDYPQEVNYGGEFEITLTLNDFDNGYYDIKIDILNGTKRLSKIWNENSWQSTFSYVNGAINTSNSNEKTFRINITERYNGSAGIEVKIRDSKNIVKSFLGYQIDIINKINSPTNPPQNNTQNQEDSISLDMDWNEDEIINGDEFEIEISAENLEDEKYNVKVWIEFEDENTVISDRYGEDSSGEEAWKSGSYYVYNLLNGPGDETEKVNLRIRDNYNDFKGDAKIFFKLSTGEEVSKDIEILEKEEDKVAEKKEVIKQNNTQEIKTTTKSTAPVSGNVIKLGSSESKETIDNTGKNTANSNLIYESKNEKIKIYAIIGFAALCLGLVILMIFKKIK